MTRRTRLDDPSTLGACLLLLSIATLAVTWWYFSDLLGAVFTMRVANATTRTLTFLAPSSRRYQELYREVATYIAVGLVVVWYWFAKYVLRTSASLNNATLLGGLFVVCVSIVTLNAPYRLLLQPYGWRFIGWTTKKVKLGIATSSASVRTTCCSFARR